MQVSTGFGTANSRDFEAIGLYMWKGRLPTDRSLGDLMALYSVEQSFVISVSAHDLQAGWYYYAVKCGPVATHFRVLATVQQALMHDGDATRRTVCPGNWAYQMVQAGPQDPSSDQDDDDVGGHRRSLMASSTPSTPATYNSTGGIEEVVIETYGHARFKLIVHSGDLYYMERHNSAPIMLAPPYGHIDYLEALASHTALEVTLTLTLAHIHTSISSYFCLSLKETIRSKHPANTVSRVAKAQQPTPRTTLDRPFFLRFSHGGTHTEEAN
jgi:hypothetical protein